MMTTVVEVMLIVLTAVGVDDDDIASFSLSFSKFENFLVILPLNYVE